MSHPDEGVLQELLDGELAGEARETLEAHVARCEACALRLDAMRATMLEADGLVELLVVPAASTSGRHQRPTPVARRRWKVSIGQMGIAAGLLIAVTAGLVMRDAWTPGRTDALTESRGNGGGAVGRQQPATAADLERSTTGAEANGGAERISDDTFRLRAGGVAAAEAEKAVAPRAKAAETRTDQAAAPPPAPLASGRENMMPEAPAPVAAKNSAPASVAAPAMLGAYARARGERKQLASLVPASVDSTSGVIRSVYVIGATQVVLEERQLKAAEDSGREQRPAAEDSGRQQQPTTAAERVEVTAKARRDAPSALVPRAEYRWTVNGVELTLRGEVSRDSLQALARLIR